MGDISGQVCQACLHPWVLTALTSASRVPCPVCVCPSPRSSGGFWAGSWVCLWPDLFFKLQQGFPDCHRTWGTTLPSSEDDWAVDGTGHPDQPAVLLLDSSHTWGSFYSPCCGPPQPLVQIPVWDSPMAIGQFLRSYGPSLHHKSIDSVVK